MCSHRSPGVVLRKSPVPVQMWQRRAQSRCRCGSGADLVLRKRALHFTHDQVRRLLRRDAQIERLCRRMRRRARATIGWHLRSRGLCGKRGQDNALFDARPLACKSSISFFGIHVAGLQCTSGMQHITSQTTRGVCTSSTHVAESVPCMQHATREAASFYSARASA